MSYARFAKNESSVYVYLDVDGYLRCCACALEPVHDTFTHTTAAMVAHLEAHRAAGHLVPDYCIEGLREDAAENDKWLAVRAAGNK